MNYRAADKRYVLLLLNCSLIISTLWKRPIMTLLT